MTASVPVTERSARRFAGVRKALDANFADGLELGARFVAYAHGEKIVDVFGGWSDKARERPWDEATLAGIYSSGKAVCALLVARAVAEGQLDYEAPVAEVWPEFAAGGKGAVVLAEAMSHQAGLAGFTEEMPPEDWLDWDAICGRLAAMAPMWPPRSASGYHPQTYGFIVGEAHRRATGRTIGETLRKDYFEAAGVEVHCGIGEGVAARAAYMPKPPRAPDLGAMNEHKRAAFLKPWSSPARVSREAWMAAELPASNMHATADALAAILQPLASDEVEGALPPEIVEAALRIRIEGRDLVLPFDLQWAAGLMRNNQGHFGPSETAYGHAGFGGSCVVIDPARGLTAAYVMNKMSEHLVGDPRAVRLLDALYEGL
ncbi:MAG: serine hydrolase [Alphaproteobacteria bacterium]|nr:serine hydrolase [Alphaproteobacteria bacterium]